MKVFGVAYSTFARTFMLSLRAFEVIVNEWMRACFLMATFTMGFVEDFELC
jgi:hypothetical protein